MALSTVVYESAILNNTSLPSNSPKSRTIPALLPEIASTSGLIPFSLHPSIFFIGTLQSRTKQSLRLSGPPQKRSVVINSPTIRLSLIRNNAPLSIEQLPNTLPISTSSLAFLSDV